MYKINIAGSQLAFDCAPGDTIARAALRAGIGIPYECNVGCCGTCKIELLSGSVESNWPAAPGLGERDRMRGRVLGCQSRPVSDCTVKARVGDQYLTGRVPRRFEAVLAGQRDLTHDMRELRFSLPEAVDFLPGQYALLQLPGVDGPRAYSMSNIARDGATWHFQIRRVPGGQGGAAIFDRMKVGDRLTIDGPYGLAYLRTANQRDIVCIAGGSGLAPMISIARGLAADPALAGRRLHFFYGGRTARDICGSDMLAELPGWGERIHYYPTISMPEADAAPWSGRTGFVHELVAEVLGASLRDHEIYFAGPPAMAQAVQRMLFEAGVPGEQVHYDAFY
ncbi:2Fe-2S iron-sulfur cluster-binding protein [Massilia niastensis]|uniref:2Fe-2S iron-sulfur cluster-binding protein n=1 Tax=Massilia niastensis TaxID=544911 RepID=UPI0004766DF3|nr:2Fe-2S iron-sulfur cluster-binding protein [Massilia niastensis]